MMSEGAKKSAIKSSEFRFKPVRGWLGSDLTEKVGSWKARVFEVSTIPEVAFELNIMASCSVRVYSRYWRQQMDAIVDIQLHTLDTL